MSDLRGGRLEWLSVDQFIRYVNRMYPEVDVMVRVVHNGPSLAGRR